MVNNRGRVRRPFRASTPLPAGLVDVEDCDEREEHLRDAWIGLTWGRVMIGGRGRTSRCHRNLHAPITTVMPKDAFRERKPALRRISCEKYTARCLLGQLVQEVGRSSTPEPNHARPSAWLTH